MPAPSYLTPAIRDIAARLHRAGFRCLVVGGAVRDAQLGRAGKDVDLATDATPEQVAKIFPNHRGTTRFGTTLLPADGELIELTTFRDEADYDDFRRPSQVRFVSDPIEDLSRRDFTINAMAYDIPTGQLIDPFGGASDLRARRLRAVGNPAERFGEDALRMLRAVRFASQLDFTIEPATATAISKCAPNLAHLSAERIGVELDKLLAGRAAGRSLRETDRLGLTRHVLPELAGRLEHPAKIIERSGILTQSARWAALFCHQQPAAAAKRITAIALGAQMAGEVAGVLHVLELTTSAAGTDVDRSRVLRRLERQTMMTGLALAQACRAVGGPAAASALASLEALLASGRPLRLAELAVNGDDLLRAGGRAPGPWLGEALNRLLDEASAGRVANERGALLARL